MQMKKAVGRGSATRKYDLLTALAVHSLAQGKTLQRQCLRLLCLITARYNWQNDQLSIGQADIARLWSVDVRTVKREMAAFRASGWLIEKRAAARGRVAIYGLGITRILEDTRASWVRVGPDLIERLDPEAEQAALPPEEPQGNVIPFPQASAPATGSLWAGVAQRLCEEDPGSWRAWFAGVEAEAGAEAEGELRLRAPSGFHASYLRTHFQRRLEALAGAILPGVRVRILN